MNRISTGPTLVEQRSLAELAEQDSTTPNPDAVGRDLSTPDTVRMAHDQRDIDQSAP